MNIDLSPEDEPLTPENIAALKASILQTATQFRACQDPYQKRSIFKKLAESCGMLLRGHDGDDTYNFIGKLEEDGFITLRERLGLSMSMIQAGFGNTTPDN